MAFGDLTIWEVESGGSDTNNGGGFDPGNANMLTDGAATVANTSAPVFTSASYNFVAGDVGAWLYIKSGTSWIAGWYKIASVASSAATLSAAIGAATTYYNANASRTDLITNTAAGCATVASPTAATWSIDYSQQSVAQISYTDIVIGATTTQGTSVAHPFGKQMVGNVIKITAGTGFTVQRVQIVSVSVITATFDKSLGTAASTGGTGGLGGALSSPGLASGQFPATNSNCVFMASGTYQMTSNTSNISNGAPVFTGAATSAASLSFFAGYGTVRGDNCVGGTRPTITGNGSVTGQNMTYWGQNGMRVYSIQVDAGSRAGCYPFFMGATQLLNNCKALNSNGSNGGFCSGVDKVDIINCEATGGSTNIPGFLSAAAIHTHYFNCISDSNGGDGFAGGLSTYHNCISFGNTGHGFNDGTFNQYCGCTSYGNTKSGFLCVSESQPSVFVNCLSVGNTRYGWEDSGADDSNCALINCAAYNNTLGNLAGGVTPGPSFVALSGSPFVATSTNFGLNSTAGAGASAMGAGFGLFTGLPSTVGSPDIGAVQHSSAGSGGTTSPLVSRIIAGGTP